MRERLMRFWFLLAALLFSQLLNATSCVKREVLQPNTEQQARLDAFDRALDVSDAAFKTALLEDPLIGDVVRQYLQFARNETSFSEAEKRRFLFEASRSELTAVILVLSEDDFSDEELVDVILAHRGKSPVWSALYAERLEKLGKSEAATKEFSRALLSSGRDALTAKIRKLSIRYLEILARFPTPDFPTDLSQFRFQCDMSWMSTAFLIMSSFDAGAIVLSDAADTLCADESESIGTRAALCFLYEKQQESALVFALLEHEDDSPISQAIDAGGECAQSPLTWLRIVEQNPEISVQQFADRLQAVCN
jgi:hypothetical protein